MTDRKSPQELIPEVLIMSEPAGTVIFKFEGYWSIDQLAIVHIAYRPTPSLYEREKGFKLIQEIARQQLGEDFEWEATPYVQAGGQYYRARAKGNFIEWSVRHGAKRV